MKMILTLTMILLATECRAQTSIRNQNSKIQSALNRGIEETNRINAVKAEEARKKAEEAQQRQEALRKVVAAAENSGKSLYGVHPDLNDARGGLYAKPVASYQIGDWGYSPKVITAVNVINKDSLLVYLQDDPLDTQIESAKFMILKGFDTSKVTTDIRFLLYHPVTITRTQTYNTAGGTTNTVLVLDRNDTFIDAQVAPVKNARAAARAKYEAFRKIIPPADATGAAVYDSFPEADRAQLIQDWKNEDAAIKQAIEFHLTKLKNMKGAGRTQQEKELAKYRSGLTRNKKNNPPYLKKVD
ncbi:MAG: hypothetical protein FD138_3587 [Planctomycetota bacterium]|nr:MAG: hypothetical protein FD138_3587 [Planctomycetota bacterium]